MPSRRFSVNKHYFDLIDTPDKAYWLGYLGADGNVSKLAVMLKCHHHDRDILEKFKESTESQHPIVEGVNNYGSHYVSLRIHSVDMVNALHSHGIIENKTWSLTPPALPPEFQPHYWRGMIDGDGWVSIAKNNKTTRFYTVGLCGNEQVILGFRDFVESRLGKSNRIVKCGPKDKPFFQVAYTGTFIAPELCHTLMYTSSLALARKQAIAQKIMAYIPAQKRPVSITLDVARNILADWQTGIYGQAQLASKYNVGKGTIYNIIFGLGRFASLN